MRIGRTQAAEPVSVKAAEPVAGTPWSITDVALEKINRELAVPAPERGGALIAVRDSRMIVDFVVDPRSGESVSYWHSDQLRRDLARYLEVHPGLRYVGTVHSHPGGYAEPSGQDHTAFENTLRSNPSIRDAIFPIVVQARSDELGNVLRLGTTHLIDLPDGTFAGYSAHPTVDGLVVRPAPMQVIPIRAHVGTAALALTELVGGDVDVDFADPLNLNGTPWLAAHFKRDDAIIAGVALSSSYPSAPPMIWSAESKLPSFAAWPLGATGTDLARVVTDLVAEKTTVDPAQIRAGIEARLAVHLPNRVDARVLLIGAGSVGSNAAEMLVRSGVRRLTVVDFDTVESANLSRTVYTAADLDELKTTALFARLTAIAPDVELTMITSPLQELTGEVFGAVDVAFLASDDLAGEGWLNHELYIRSIPFVSVKVFAGAEGAELAYVVPSQNTACLRCMMGSLGAGDRGEVNYGTGRVNGSPALGPDIIAATARGVKVALALTQSDGPLADWLAELGSRRLTYFLSSNVTGWKYTEFAHPGSLPFDGLWVAAPGRGDCEICGDVRAAETQPARIAEFTAEPPSAESTEQWSSSDHGLTSPR